MRDPHAADRYSDSLPDPAMQPFFNFPGDQGGFLKALLGTIQLYFGAFNGLFSQITDPRSPKKITYPFPALAFAGVLMFLCHVGARRQIRMQLHTVPSAGTFQALFGVDTIFHLRLKSAFPRLPIMLTLDALYACGPVFQICTNFGWKYITLRRIPTPASK